MAKYGAMGREKTDGAVFKGGYLSGEDAAYIKPRLIPDYELEPRDDSGGPEWDAYTAEFGDGGYVTGEKAHLSARGGSDDPEIEDEVDEQTRRGSAKAIPKGMREPPSSSRKLSKE